MPSGQLYVNRKKQQQNLREDITSIPSQSWTGCLFPREPPAGRHYTALSELMISSASRERERDVRDVNPLQLEHTESLTSDEGILINNNTISRGNSCFCFVFCLPFPTSYPTALHALNMHYN